ncbi:threonine/serine exporter family protein [Campylobacter sp. US33a]|uniref:Threonine/serine exporter family protein n=1 Tax=Campylobacter sp. CCS1377 TaxID=3158229 RepID=A0AAU7E7Y9_9BACT|nr:threonine/serine exporter family protein [Campylobacter sp. US33a]MCW1360075.1 threonine/serine exporter family protein [Campylobacter jejuni]TEY02375.1 threonine/serine exporter family protein [Campylobacter sp. US33a]
MSDLSLIALDMFFAAVAGFGFAYACNPPLKTLFLSAILAAIGHGFRFMLLEFFHFQTLAIATFLASFVVGCLGMLLAKIFKTPAEIIAFPALLPMIPGIYAYRAILYLISFIRSEDMVLQTSYLVNFFNYFFLTLSVTLALAVGVSMTLLIFFEQSFMMTRNAKFLKK